VYSSGSSVPWASVIQALRVAPAPELGVVVARLYTVVTLWEAERLARRRRLEVSGALVVEEKLDGILLVAYDGRLYTGSGRRAPPRLRRGLEEAGAGDAVEASRGGKLVYIELYGRCVPGETGLHRSYPGPCHRAAFLDAAVAPAHAGPVTEAAALARLVQHPERLGYAEGAGLEKPRGLVLDAGRLSPGGLLDLLALYPGAEGVVVKLYRGMGHRLPPDYGAKLRGGLAVKMRWEWFAERWR